MVNISFGLHLLEKGEPLSFQEIISESVGKDPEKSLYYLSYVWQKFLEYSTENEVLIEGEAVIHINRIAELLYHIAIIPEDELLKVDFENMELIKKLSGKTYA